MTTNTNTILIVDDEIVNLRMLERLLRSHYNVRTATSGPAALQILKQENISLLISDQRMPGMSGLELLRVSREINPDLVSMLVTANTENDTSAEAIHQAGALRVIHKPWNPETFLQFVRDALIQRETLVACRQANAEIEATLSQLKIAAEEFRLFPQYD